MDRRTILAFVLMIAVLILFQYFIPKPQKRTTPQAPVSDTTAAAGTIAEGSRGSTTPASPSRGPAQQAGAVHGARFVNVMAGAEDLPAPLHLESGLFDAELDPRGALVRRWVLDEYTDAREQTADLVADPDSGLFRFGLVLQNEEIDLSLTRFTLAPEQPEGGRGVSLVARDSTGASVRIDYTVRPGRYLTQVQVTIEGLPEVGDDRFLEVSFPEGIPVLERDPKVDERATAAVALLGRRYVKHGLGGEPWQEQENGVVRWAGVRSKYFLLAAIPSGAPDGIVRLARPGKDKSVTAALRMPLNLSGASVFEFEIFGGPMEYQVLEAEGVGLERNVDLGWRLLVPFSRLLLKFFQAVYALVHNYGLVILVLSILTKVLFYPLTKKSMESMKQMQLLKPEIDRLNAKYKDDAQKRNQAMLDLYKKHKINPLGGCLPILIQMPVFIALYNVLNSAIELRKAPFTLWIQDLSAPDRVGYILGLPLHVLPLVMAVTMIWQQKLTPTDPRQAALAYIMPIFMTIFFYPMPSGLVFYWTVNNLMSIGQQMWMNRTMKQQLAVA